MKNVCYYCNAPVEDGHEPLCPTKDEHSVRATEEFKRGFKARKSGYITQEQVFAASTYYNAGRQKAEGEILTATAFDASFAHTHCNHA
jgi:hypothetical protein